MAAAAPAQPAYPNGGNSYNINSLTVFDVM
jgi:hypothetical protein